MKTPGDPAWCWQTVSALQSMWKSLDLDYERYTRTLKEAEEHRIWERIPPGNPYGSKEAMLEAAALGDEAAARARVAIQGLNGRPMAIRERGKDGRYHAVTPPGAVQHQEFTRTKRGSSHADYLTARIARDRPDVWERMKAGEFTSVAAAAREAGIPYKVPKRISVTDPATVAKALRKAFSPEDLQALISELQDPS